MGLTTLFDAPFFEGTAVTSEVPGRFHVSLNGRPYMVDLAHDQAGIRSQFFHRQTIQTIRTQADNASVPSEHSLNPEELWRRSTESWHHGAGQIHYDRSDSDPWQFRTSKGMDCWTRWQIGLLHQTTQKRSSANTNLAVLRVGGRLYLADGTEVYKTAALSGVGSPTWTATNVNIAEGAQTVQSITADGYNLYAALGTNGIHTSVYDTTVWTHYGNNPAGSTYTLVGFVKGRLMAAAGAAIYNLTAAGAAPAANFTHPATDWVWTAFAEGQNVIYAAGFSGAKSTVYRITLRPDGTALDVAVPAAPDLPLGEIVRSIYGYLGFVFLGTDKGVRFCTADSTGNLTIGPFISTTSAVRCFDGQDRFVWYGLSSYDSVSSGLGRLDVSQFTQPLVPAYASDVMAGGGFDDTALSPSVQANVLSAATFENLRVFAVSGVGVYQESVNVYVPSGTLDSGFISYGIVDEKISVFLDIRTLLTQTTNPGSYKAYLSTDGGSFTLLGTFNHVAQLSASFPTNEARGETFEVRSELDRDGSDTTHSPTLTRTTLRCSPAPVRGMIVTVPLILHESMLDVHEAGFSRDPLEELSILEDLASSHQLVTYQDASQSLSVFVETVTWMPYSLTEDLSFWNGIASVELKVLPPN